MNKYEILTTSMKKIFVECKTEDEASKIAKGQMKDGEEIIMISSSKNLI